MSRGQVVLAGGGEALKRRLPPEGAVAAVVIVEVAERVVAVAPLLL